MDKFLGSIAVVTGASAGIGRGIVHELLKTSDIKVIGLARRDIDISHANFKSFKCDVGNAAQVKNVFQNIRNEFPDMKISILINNAGHAKPLPIMQHPKLETSATLSGEKYDDLEEATKVYESMINTNVIGATIVTREGSKLFDHTKCGNIININSMSGHRVVPSPDTHFYTVTKYAVTALTEATRQELRAMNSQVRANQISPGFVATDFFDAVSQDAEYREKMSKIAASALTVENIVDAVMLCLKSTPNCQVGDIQMRPTVQIT